MSNAKSIYGTTLMSGMALIAVIFCCVAFIGCPTAEEMADDVIAPSTDEPPPPPETDEPPPPPQEDGPPPPPPEEDGPPPPPDG